MRGQMARLICTDPSPASGLRPYATLSRKGRGVIRTCMSETVLRLRASPSGSGRSSPMTRSRFELQRGEIVALLGENGAGKTTLMNILFGHYVADEGAIEVFGKPLPPGEPRAAIAAGIGMVHQHFTLAENLTVLDNIVLGTEPLWRLASDRAGARRRIEQAGGRISAWRSIPMRGSAISRSASASASRS